MIAEGIFVGIHGIPKLMIISIDDDNFHYVAFPMRGIFVLFFWFRETILETPNVWPAIPPEQDKSGYNFSMQS